MYAPVPRPKRPQVRLVLDFDGTLTVDNTLSALADAASSTISPSSNLGDRTVLALWKELEQEYSQDLQLQSAGYQPTAKQRSRIEEEVQWLESLRKIESGNWERVVSSGLFDGVTAGTLHRHAEECFAAEEVEFRQGWQELIGMVSRGPESSVSIASANFSRTWVRACLQVATLDFDSSEGLRFVRSIQVFGNELPAVEAEDRPAEDEVYHDMTVEVRTSADKAKILSRVQSPSEKSVLIYMGDSCTDLECLLRATMGICLRDDPMTSDQRQLKDTFDRLGKRVMHVEHMAADSLESGIHIGVWWCRDFVEVRKALIRLGIL